MIIVRTPFRISFAGGGSDLPAFYHKKEGCVLSTSINKYMYVFIHPTFSGSETVIKYSTTEAVENIRDIRHPIARQILMDNKLSGVEIVSVADIPSGTGLSSSSAYTVSVLHAVYAYMGKYCSQKRIARDACRIEIEELGETIGKQDQYGTAVGGLKFITFKQDGSVEIEPLIINKRVKKELDENLLLFYTGIKHSASEILEEQKENVISDDVKFRNLSQMTDLARQMRESLLAGNLDDFGRILDENWRKKKELASKISNDNIDKYYEIAMDNGALGGKLLGAGGGGFLLFYCPKDKQLRLKSALSDLIELPFEMENEGTRVIYVGEKDWD